MDVPAGRTVARKKLVDHVGHRPQPDHTVVAAGRRLGRGHLLSQFVDEGMLAQLAIAGYAGVGGSKAQVEARHAVVVEPLLCKVVQRAPRW